MEIYYKIKISIFLIQVHYVFKIIYVELNFDAWISYPVNKQNICSVSL